MCIWYSFKLVSLQPAHDVFADGAQIVPNIRPLPLLLVVEDAADNVGAGEHDGSQRNLADVDMGEVDARDTDPTQMWREQHKGVRNNALAFLAHVHSASDNLIALRIIMEPQARLMDALVQLSSARWEKAQLASQATIGQREFKITAPASGGFEHTCYRERFGSLQVLVL